LNVTPEELVLGLKLPLGWKTAVRVWLPNLNPVTVKLAVDVFPLPVVTDFVGPKFTPLSCS
jgi:hypothetical protein